MPVSENTCALLGALSAMVTFAVSVPLIEGVNVTVIVQVAWGATALVQVLVWLKSALLVPVTLTPVTFRSVLPVLVTVTVCGLLVVPTFWLPKLRLDGDSATFGLGVNLLTKTSLAPA